MSAKTVLVRVLVGLGAIALIGCAVVAVSLVRGGALTSAANISPNQCAEIEIDIGSAEDIEIDKESGDVFLSVLDRRGIVSGEPVRGDIFSFNMNDSRMSVMSVLERIPDVFRPHGISIYRDQNGNQSLLVINHSPIDGESIEVFTRHSGDVLFSHSDTLTDQSLIEPNDIVAIGPRQFYVANDSGATNGIGRAAEMLLAFGMSPLVYFDGVKFHVPVDDLKSSGGINANLKRRELYVGETIGKRIRIYDISATGALGRLKDVIALDGGPDNISIDEDGSLWVANHINTLALVKHFGDESQLAPTQVQKVAFNETRAESPVTFFENEGEKISAGSVGAVYLNKLAIGSITENKILLCDLDLKAGS